MQAIGPRDNNQYLIPINTTTKQMFYYVCQRTILMYIFITFNLIVLKNLQSIEGRGKT
jgi:hypothetical protein